MHATLIQPPRIEPVTLAEARQWLRDDSYDEDQIIQTLIVSARMTLEAFTRRFLLEQRWRLAYDFWPETAISANTIAIPFAPCRSIDAIRVYEVSSIPITMDTGNYHLSTSSDAARIVFQAPPPPPMRAHDSVEIDITVGYSAEPLQIPEPFRRAILMLVAAWHHQRGDGPETILPDSVLRLVTPFRRERLI
jgi:uncharacterized phiE125 gp8 family phage protein